MRKFFKALTLVSLTSVSAPVSAQDAVYQFYQISYQNAVEGCNVGYSPSCQMINKIPQFVMFYEEALRRCSNGNQQVCSDVRQLRVRATQGIAQDRREKANIYRTTPSTGFGGGKSPGEILGEANDITHGGYIARSGSSYSGHQNTINGIHGTQTLTGPSGNSFTVEGYENYHWGNGNGTIIGTDNPNFNPNTAPEYFNGNWNLYGN